MERVVIKILGYYLSLLPLILGNGGEEAILPENDACLILSVPCSHLFHLFCFGIRLLLATLLLKISVADFEIFCLPAQGRIEQNIFHMLKSKRKNFFGG